MLRFLKGWTARSAPELLGFSDPVLTAHSLLLYPGDYPFKPPDIKLFTPSGRFKPETKICTSMTSFHPSTWNPAWSVATILTGLLSFMLSDEITTGSMTATAADRKLLAEKSHAFNVGNKKFRDNFPDVRPARTIICSRTL